ncbi:MAG TPA: S-layer homology domain-containing protein [Candidatus Galloscillospira excrementavium]|nr:S-layer homology domain-containing protein [Candidatus Galloscillospira excrementavium]
MKSKCIALLLTLSLSLGLAGTALAAGVEDLFPAIREYPGYSDVADGTWYADAAQVCYETGLLSGTAVDTFSPESTMTVAQATTLAARIRDILNGGDGELENPAGAPWYAGAIAIGEELSRSAGRVDLLSCLSFPDEPITRAQFFGLMSLVVGEDLLTPVNAVYVLPDTDDAAILRFYQAGILTGTDSYGSFHGDNTLRRADAAVMTSRIIRPALRNRSFIPTPLPLVCQAAGVLPGEAFFQGDRTVTAQEYLTLAQTLIEELEAACAEAGMEFNWYNTYGEETFLNYVKDEAISRLGVTSAQGTDAYRNLDLQVFYSRLLDLTEAGTVYGLYVGTEGDFTVYPTEAITLDPAEESAQVVRALLAEMSALTGWNLDTADITVGRSGVTVAFADTSALYVGPPDPQVEAFHVYGAEELAFTLLDGVKRTLQCAFSPVDPEGLDVWFCAADGSALTLDNLGVTLPVEEPYSHALLENLLAGA